PTRASLAKARRARIHGPRLGWVAGHRARRLHIRTLAHNRRIDSHRLLLATLRVRTSNSRTRRGRRAAVRAAWIENPRPAARPVASIEHAAATRARRLRGTLRDGLRYITNTTRRRRLRRLELPPAAVLARRILRSVLRPILDRRSGHFRPTASLHSATP